MALNLHGLTGRSKNVADEFERTIISFESPYRLKDLCPPVASGPEVSEENMGEKQFKIRFAQSEDALYSASLLVQKRYAWRGLPKAKLKRYPNRVTLLTYLGDRIVGTVTVGYDSEEGLFADDLYKTEIDSLRAQGRCVGELGKLAIDEELGNKQVLGAIIHIAYIYGLMHECTDAVIEIVPRHKAFYERMLGFKQLGEELPNPKASNAPALLMHLPLEYMAQKITEVGGKGSTVKDRSLYPYFFSLHDQQGIMERLRQSV